MGKLGQQFEHLTDAQIEHYGETIAGAGPDQEQQIEAHLADCPGCRARVLAFHRARFSPASTIAGRFGPETGSAANANTGSAATLANSMTDSSPSTARRPDQPAPDSPSPDHPGLHPLGPDCASDDAIRSLAAGLTPTDEAAPLIHHAAECARCGHILRMYTEDFSDDLASQDQALLAQLQSSSPGWQKKLVRELQAANSGADAPASAAAVSSRSILKLPWFRWALIPATVAACAAIAFFVWYQQRDTPEKVEKLLAQAYTEQRTMELRWPGADWTPTHDVRNTELPPPPLSLQEADLLIARQLKQTPGDLAWLQRRAEAELLSWKSGPALEDLKRLQDAGTTNSSSLLLDLAIAHFQLGQRSSNPTEYGVTANILGELLKQEPQNRAALFNRALVYEKLHFYHEAQADWEHYLQIENNGAWADEARAHLRDIKILLKNQEQSVAPLLEPSSFLALGESGQQLERPRLDQYFEIALSDWLKRAVSSPRDPPAYDAIHKLATQIEHEKRDQWLSDFATALDDPALYKGISALSDAVRASATGNTSLAKQKSNEAEQELKHQGNTPGLLFAQFELIYAEGRSGHAKECREKLDSSLPVPDQYPWLRTQLSIQRAICTGMLNDLGKAGDLISRLLKDELMIRFPTLRLRALGTAASLETAKGNFSKAWSLNLDGLAAYWNGTYPVLRSYQFYDGLSYGAESAGLKNLVLAIARESVAAVSLSKDKPTQAMSRYQLAKAEFAAGMHNEAKAEFARAESIFESLAPSSDNDFYRSDGQISIAEIETETNAFSDAENRLASLQTRIQNSDNFTVKLRFYNAESELALKNASYLNAEGYLLQAASISEAGFDSLRTDQDRAAWDREVRNVYRQLASITLRERHNPELALYAWEWYKTSSLRTGYLESRAGTRSVPADGFASLEQLIASLPVDLKTTLQKMNRTTTVSYAELRDQIVAWVFDDRGVEAIALPISRQQAAVLVQRFVRECADPDSDLQSLQNDARELFRDMIQPFQRRLDPRRSLIVESDGELSKVPVSALIDESGHYLGERFRVVLSPGTFFLDLLPNTQQQLKTLKLLSVGLEEVPESSGLPPLPDAAKEAAIVAGLFPKAILLIDHEATRRNIAAHLSGVRIFHFAGHATSTPSGISLLLHDDGNGTNLISAQQLTRDRVGDLVLAVLSACATEGPFGSGTGDPQSLVRSFLKSGVPHVVATSWSVDSSATRAFMTVFYSKLAAGENIAAAMQDAATSIRTHPATAHPYYWAGFDLFGRI